MATTEASGGPRCPTPFAHIRASQGVTGSTPPRWQTLLNRLSGANPLARPGAAFSPSPLSVSVTTSRAHHQLAGDAVGIPSAPPVTGAGLKPNRHLRQAVVAAGHTRLIPKNGVAGPTCAALVVTASPTSTSPKTPVQTAIAQLRAMEAAKDAARARKKAEKEAAGKLQLRARRQKCLTGAAATAARTRSDALAAHRPAREPSVTLEVSDEDDSDGEETSSGLSVSDWSAGGAGANKRKRDGERKHKKHHHHHHHGKHGHGKHKHHASKDDLGRKNHHHHRHNTRHSKHKRHKAAEESNKKHRRRHHHHNHGDGVTDQQALDAHRLEWEAVSVSNHDSEPDNHAMKAEATEEREARVETECSSQKAEGGVIKRTWSQTGLAGVMRRSFGNLVGLLDDAYGSFIGGSPTRVDVAM